MAENKKFCDFPVDTGDWNGYAAPFHDAAESPEKNNAKRDAPTKRRSFSYQEKWEILRLLETESKGSVCKRFTLNECMLNRWLKQATKIEQMCQNNFTKKLKKDRPSEIEEVNDKLYAWFLEERARGTPISGTILKARALIISEGLRILNFKASDQWLSGWKHKKNVRLLGPQGDRWSADAPAATERTTEFRDIVRENGLTRAQVFNFDEFTLNFKMLPTRTFATIDERQASEFKEDKSRVTIAACSNADGSLKLPLVFIGKSQKLRALKKRSAGNSPLYYCCSRNAWTITSVLKTWFETEFVPRVREFLRRSCLPIKALLLLDNRKCHVTLSVGDIATEFLPSVSQPMAQGILETLKRRYRARLVSSILEAANNDVAIQDLLKSIAIGDVVDWVSDAWEEMPRIAIYRCWRKLWPFDSREATTQTDETSTGPRPLNSSVDRESDETILESTVNSLEIMQSLRSIAGFEVIEREDIDRWMMAERKWDVVAKRRYLKSDVVPSRNLPNSDTAEAGDARKRRKSTRSSEETESQRFSEAEESVPSQREDDPGIKTEELDLATAEIPERPMFVKCEPVWIEPVDARVHGDFPAPKLMDFASSDAELSALTGIESLAIFDAIVAIATEMLGNRLENDDNTMNIRDKIFLTYVKLKQNMSYDCLAILTQCCSATACQQIFFDTMRDLSACLRSFIRWPSRETVSSNMPVCFKGFDDVRVILDCTEISVQNGESTETRKFLTGVTPVGNVSYLSGAFDGQTSDRAMFDGCEIKDLLQPDDAIMVDVGLTIDEKSIANNWKCYRLSLMGKTQQVPKSATISTPKTAEPRVRIERLHRRIKKFQIVKETMPANLVAIVEEIFLVICATINLNATTIKLEEFVRS